MYLIVVVWFLSWIDNNAALIAYDCFDANINFTAVSLNDVSPCPNPETDYTEETVDVSVVQKDELNHVEVKSCLVEVTRIITYCGMHSHSSLVKNGLYNYIHPVGSSTCRDIHRYRAVSLFNRLIGQVLMNGTTSESFTIVGSVDNEGSCQGGSYNENGVEWNNVVVVASVKITAKNYWAPVKLRENIVSLLGGITCPYVDGYCFDSTDGETMWELDLGKQCEDGLTALYQGQAQMVTEKPSRKYLVVEENDRVFALTLMKKSKHCDFDVWITEHPQILVVTEASSTRARTLKTTSTTQNTNLMLYVNSKFLYVEQSYKRSLQQMYSDTIYRRCLLHREILLNRLTMAPLAPAAVGVLLKKNLGYLVKVLGEVLYIVKCVPRQVEIRRTDHCYHELPISVNNDSYFMSPVTHIIQKHAEEIECNLITPPLYQIDGRWVGLTPDPRFADPPRKLGLEPEKQLKFSPIQPVSASGIYTIDEINKAQRSLTFGMERAAVENIIARRVAGLDANSQGYSTLNLLEKADIEKLARSTLEKIWGWFTDIGIFFSGVMGVYIIIRGLKYAVGVLLNAFQLYKMVGFSFTLLASLWSTLTMWVIHRHQQRTTVGIDTSVEDIPSAQTTPVEGPSCSTNTPTALPTLYPDLQHWTEREAITAPRK